MYSSIWTDYCNCLALILKSTKRLLKFSFSKSLMKIQNSGKGPRIRFGLLLECLYYIQHLKSFPRLVSHQRDEKMLLSEYFLPLVEDQTAAHTVGRGTPSMAEFNYSATTFARCTFINYFIIMYYIVAR